MVVSFIACHLRCRKTSVLLRASLFLYFLCLSIFVCLFVCVLYTLWDVQVETWHLQTRVVLVQLWCCVLACEWEMNCCASYVASLVGRRVRCSNLDSFAQTSVGVNPFVSIGIYTWWISHLLRQVCLEIFSATSSNLATRGEGATYIQQAVLLRLAS